MPPNEKLTQKTENTAPISTDILYLVDDPGGVPLIQKVQVANIHKGMTVGTTSVAGVLPTATVAQTLAGTATASAVTPDGLYSGVLWRVRGTIVDPQTVYTKRAELPIFRADAALTITRIHIACNDSTPTAELAGDLKFADDIFDGSFANATVIDVCDTTSGAFTATTGFDDATIPSGKYVYFSFDASPHADIDEIYIEVYYTYD